MRYSIAVVALAGLAAALPQESYSVQPITQISDGQIQAPPASSAPAVSYSAPPVEVTSAVSGKLALSPLH